MRYLGLILPFVFLLQQPLLAQNTGADSTRQQVRQWYTQAQRHLEGYQFDQALQLLTRCYNKDSGDIGILGKIAYCHQQMGRFRDAKVYHQEVLKRDSTNTNALNSLAIIAGQERHYRQAEEQYDRLLSLDTTNAYYYKRAAFTALRVGNTLKGIALFQRAHILNEADMEVIDQLSTIYIALKQLDFAERLLQKGLNRAPSNISLLQNKAQLHQKRNENEEVVSAIEQAMAQGDTTDYYQMMLGVAYLKIDSLQQGIWHLKKIVDRQKDTDKTHHYLGLAYFYQKDYERAEEHLRQAIELGVSPKMGDYYKDLANLNLKQKERPQAIRNYRRALEYKTDAQTLYLLANQTDVYYRDKSIALNYYQQYLSSQDSTYREDAEDRVRYLREIVHQQGGRP